MNKKFPATPAHPERTCWGCDLYCSSKAMACGNGAERTQHPVEFIGLNWQTYFIDQDHSSAPTKSAYPETAVVNSDIGTERSHS